MNTTPIEFLVWHKTVGMMTTEMLFNPSETVNKQFKDERFEFLQRTALRSINDEPIYNHMIVKDVYGVHYVIDMFNYEIMYDLSMSFITEIVGNRFQSPELLELCK